MKNVIVTATLVASLFTTSALMAQDLPEVPGPVKEHEWLQRFVGEWDVVSEGTMGEGQPPIKGEATMKSSMLGKIWIVNTSEMEIAGTPMKSIQMIGYDTDKKKYVGIWVDSMMNHMWKYEGDVDKSGNKIMLEAEGPSMTGEGSAKYMDSYEFTDADTIVSTSSVQGPDGKWITIMTGKATRRK